MPQLPGDPSSGQKYWYDSTIGTQIAVCTSGKYAQDSQLITPAPARRKSKLPPGIMHRVITE